eukprot:IDg21460t1
MERLSLSSRARLHQLALDAVRLIRQTLRATGVLLSNPDYGPKARSLCHAYPQPSSGSLGRAGTHYARTACVLGV